MILQSLDLDALQGAVLWSTNRRLSDFLLETLNGSLPRFHTCLLYTSDAADE